MKTTSRICRVNGVELHVSEAGPLDGPLAIFLHGFPDFWWGWRYQIEALSAQGFRVVAPDQRGYGVSDKPRGTRAYDLDTLAADVIGLADFYGRKTFRLAGHDWGGIIAWHVAARYPARIERLAVLNAPHPDAFLRFVRRHLRQALRSTYAAFFQLPWLPEMLLDAGRFAALRRALVSSSRPGTFPDDDLERYVEAWKQPGALTAMLNYYRALGRRSWTRPSRISVPTLLIWGLRDVFLEPGVARASLKLCDDAQSLFLETAGHWVQLEETGAVNTALVRFFGPL